MQLSGKVLRAIEQVLGDAEHKPADSVLRVVLRGNDFDPDQKTLISRAVFTYFRWRGWLNSKNTIRGQLEHAFDLAASPPNDAEILQKAIPPWARELGCFSAGTLREIQMEPRLWLRARPGSALRLAAQLGDCEPHPEVPDALWYQGENDLFRTDQFWSGAFEIQDLSSQVVGLTCAPLPGATWWDACAGEGGKTLHLCDLMANKGLVWASDPAAWRLDTLKRRASRAKLFNYRLKTWKTQEHLPTKTKFDGVLVDAPCSGLGTWGRNPHARWTANAEEIPRLAALQKALLDKVAGSVKAGGRLIYSVCTLTKAETTEVSAAFGNTHPEFQRTEEKTLLPEQWHAAGMFIAAWQRA